MKTTWSFLLFITFAAMPVSAFAWGQSLTLNNNNRAVMKALETTIANIEVERVESELEYSPGSPEYRKLLKELNANRRRLAQLRPAGSAATTEVIIKALNTKINQLKSKGANKDNTLIDIFRSRRTEFYKQLEKIYSNQKKIAATKQDSAPDRV